MWKHVKEVAVPETIHSNDNNAIQQRGDGGGGDGRSSPAMAGIAQAAMALAASTASRKKPRAQTSLTASGADKPPPVCGESDSGCPGGGQGPQEERENSSSSRGLESTEPRMLGDTQGGDGDGNGSCTKGMRQESYYLRGKIEADRDCELLATIADCVPGIMALSPPLLRSLLVQLVGMLDSKYRLRQYGVYVINIDYADRQRYTMYLQYFLRSSFVSLIGLRAHAEHVCLWRCAGT